MSAAQEEKCPVHRYVEVEMEKMRTRQDSRPCDTNTERIIVLMKSDAEQWTAINQLRKTVWFGAGAAFMGSAAATFLLQLIFRVKG